MQNGSINIHISIEKKPLFAPLTLPFCVPVAALGGCIGRPCGATRHLTSVWTNDAALRLPIRLDLFFPPIRISRRFLSHFWTDFMSAGEFYGPEFSRLAHMFAPFLMQFIRLRRPDERKYIGCSRSRAKRRILCWEKDSVLFFSYHFCSDA